MKTFSLEVGRTITYHHNDGTANVYVLTEPFTGTDEQLYQRIKNLTGCRHATEDEVRLAFIQRLSDSMTIVVGSFTIRRVNGLWHKWKSRRQFVGSRKALYKYERKHYRIGVSNRYAQYIGRMYHSQVARLQEAALQSAINNSNNL